MSDSRYRQLLQPLLEETEAHSIVADSFVDKDLYQLYVATIWSQLALQPEDAGLTEDDLEPVHDYLNQAIAPILGAGHDLTACFHFINSKAGEQAMNRYRLPPHHRDLLLYFCSAILDPEGHRRWAEEQNKKL